VIGPFTLFLFHIYPFILLPLFSRFITVPLGEKRSPCIHLGSDQKWSVGYREGVAERSKTGMRVCLLPMYILSSSCGSFVSVPAWTWLTLACEVFSWIPGFWGRGLYAIHVWRIMLRIIFNLLFLLAELLLNYRWSRCIGRGTLPGIIDVFRTGGIIMSQVLPIGL